MDSVATADGVTIFYKDWGPKDAQPLVFHHGWPLSADDAQLLYFGMSFSLIGRPINILADLGNILICVSRLYIDNQTLPVRRSNQPPVRESRVGGTNHRMTAMARMRRMLTFRTSMEVC